MAGVIKRQPMARSIAAGFVFVILLGSILLMLPCSIQEGMELGYIDSLYTSASAVCVTGLAVVDAGSTFTPLGQFFLLLLILIMYIGRLGPLTVASLWYFSKGERVSLPNGNIVIG